MAYIPHPGPCEHGVVDDVCVLCSRREIRIVYDNGTEAIGVCAMAAETWERFLDDNPDRDRYGRPIVRKAADSYYTWADLNKDIAKALEGDDA